MGKTCNVSTPVTSVNGIYIDRSKLCNYSNYTNMSSRNIDYIVMHYTGNQKDNAKNNANYFMGANREASSHYFVDDVSIWQSVDINDKAWHCGTSGTYYHSACRNSNSIGIEMCCTAGNYKIGDKTKENAAQLCAALCKYLGITDVDKYVVRHYDVTHKNCPAQMSGASNAEWDVFKARVKAILGVQAKTNTKSVKEIAKEVMEGKWGNGIDRKNRLTAAGYDYNAVQSAVNALVSGKDVAPTKSIEQIAKEVIQGKWGNGDDRKKKLTAAGYDYNVVQKKVNELL